MRLIVDGIEFGYGSSPLLQDIGFEAERGDIIGILGENGCGKTTLLKCIDGLLRIRSGYVGVADREDGGPDEDLLAMRPAELARTVAVVSQNAGSTFPFTALDVVMMGRYARSRTEPGSRGSDVEAAAEALEMAGAAEFAHRNVMELSGGEFRRVMIARALCQEPSVLLLDEPTLHLDTSHQFELMELIGRLSAERRIVTVIVTHDIVLAARYCTRIIMMEKGRIVHAGDSADVMTEGNFRDVFGLEARIGRDPDIPGLSVTLIGRARGRGSPDAGTDMA